MERMREGRTVYMAITLLNNETLFERYMRGRDSQRLEALFEMARRVGTSGAMLLEEYRTDAGFRASVDGDTVRLFKQYKLNGGQMDAY